METTTIIETDFFFHIKIESTAPLTDEVRTSAVELAEDALFSVSESKSRHGPYCVMYNESESAELLNDESIKRLIIWEVSPHQLLSEPLYAAIIVSRREIIQRIKETNGYA